MKKSNWVMVGVVVVVVGLGLYFLGVFSGASPLGGDTGFVPPQGSNLKSDGEPEPITSTAGAVSEVKGSLNGKGKAPSGQTVDFPLVVLGMFDPATGKELQRTTLAADGSYKFSVTAGEYLLDVIEGKSTQLPQQIYIGKEEVIELNFKVTN